MKNTNHARAIALFAIFLAPLAGAANLNVSVVDFRQDGANNLD